MAALIDLKHGLNLWATERVRPGSFLRAVLANDLKDAVARADPESLAVLKDVVSYIHWELPGLCHGSWEKVKAWENGREHKIRHVHLGPDRACGRCGKDLADAVHFRANEMP